MLVIEASTADEEDRLKKMREALWGTYDANRDIAGSQGAMNKLPVETVIVEVAKPVIQEPQPSPVIKTAPKQVVVEAPVVAEPKPIVIAQPAPSPSKLRVTWDPKSEKMTYTSGMSDAEKLRDLNTLYKLSIIRPGVYHTERSKLKLQ